MKILNNVREKTKYLFYKMISLKGCPHQLAKSFSLGFTLAILPLPAVNVVLSALLARLLNLNILATVLPGLLLTYVAPFLYIFNYQVGAIFIQSDSKFEYREIDHSLPLLERIVDFFANLGAAYLLGSIMNAAIVAVVSYFAFYYFFKSKNGNSEQQSFINDKKIFIKKRTSSIKSKPFTAKVKNSKKI